MKKRSFFERLSGSVPMTDDYDAFDDDLAPVSSGLPITRAPSAGLPQAIKKSPQSTVSSLQTALLGGDEDPAEGQLPVDVYQTPSEIVIRTFVAGVRPDEMNVSISRDMVVIEGSREERTQVTDSDYFSRELFWGSFSKTILLPQEVDVENSSATAKDGLLTIILPKLDKARQTKLKVKLG